MTIEWMMRRAALADMQAIIGIEQSSVEAPHWSEGVWRAVLAKEERSEPLRATFLAESGGRVVGFVVVSCAGGMAELESVAVEVGERRQGVGKALCIAAMAWARGRALKLIELEVRASSVGAVALYRSLGFMERGTRRRYYRDPIEDAVMMSALLGSSH
jgi:ribosomal-protein-alanine N-acetyltransferase